MICSNCRTDKPDTYEHFPWRNGKRNGQVCRECKRMKSRNRGFGICHHCGTPILDRQKSAQYHIDQAHPDCYAAYHAHTIEVQRRGQRRYDQERRPKAIAKAKAARWLCPDCGRPMELECVIRCWDCWRSVQNSVDVEWALCLG
jgi:hypothetical protein